MCGRYGHKDLPAAIAEDLGVEIVSEVKGWIPGEAAPTTRQPVMGTRGLGFAHWGWQRDFSSRPLFNARDDKLVNSPLWGPALEQRRCLVPAPWWYEWNGPKGQRQKWQLGHADDTLMTFAGLWEHTDSGPVFTVITRPALPHIAHVHDRMPGLILAEGRDQWLRGSQQEALTLLRLMDLDVRVQPA